MFLAGAPRVIDGRLDPRGGGVGLRAQSRESRVISIIIIMYTKYIISLIIYIILMFDELGSF